MDVLAILWKTFQRSRNRKLKRFFGHGNMYFDLVMFWMSDYAWMANFWCHFLIKRLLTDRIALLLSFRGRTELGEMFRIDCRRFLFSPPLPPSCPPPPHFAPGFCALQAPSFPHPPARSLVRSLRPEKEKKKNVWKSKNIQDDILKISDSETERIKNGTQWLMQHKEFRYFWIVWKVSATHNFLGSIRHHPTHRTRKTKV